MITSIDELRIVSSNKIVAITCDFCKKQTVSKENPEFEDITSFEIKPGYGSVYDFQEFNLEICDACIRSKIIPLTQKGVCPEILTCEEADFLLSAD